MLNLQGVYEACLEKISKDDGFISLLESVSGSHCIDMLSLMVHFVYQLFCYFQLQLWRQYEHCVDSHMPASVQVL